MKMKYLKLTGMMTAALLCLFTSCEPIEDEDSNVVTTVNVEMLVSAETLKWAEGNFIITFSPSGKTEKIPANEVFFAFEAKPSTAIETLMLKEFKSTKVMKASCSTICNASDTKVTVTPDLKIRAGIATTDDKEYDYEVTGCISYHKFLGAEHTTHSYSHGFGLKGTELAGFLTGNNISLVSLDIQ